MYLDLKIMENSLLVQLRKKNVWYGKIENKEEALKVIKLSSNSFYFLAVFQGVIGYFIMGIDAIINGVLFAVCAFLLQKFGSRVAAVILFLLSSGALFYTVISKFGGGTGGRNVILAVIVFWVSVRATQATFVLRKLKKV